MEKKETESCCSKSTEENNGDDVLCQQCGYRSLQKEIEVLEKCVKILAISLIQFELKQLEIDKEIEIISKQIQELNVNIENSERLKEEEEAKYQNIIKKMFLLFMYLLWMLEHGYSID